MSDFERFVGVWDLKGIEDEDEGEEEKTFLEGKRGGVDLGGAESRERIPHAARPALGFSRPVGLLIYLPSGVMSVNFSAASRIPFLREFSPSPSELAAAGAAYGGYAGRWELDEPRREVLHHVETAFIPNRVGRTIRRSYSFSEDLSLLLLHPIPLSPADEAPNRVLCWRRRPTP